MRKIKVLQQICVLSMIFIVGGMNAETVSFHNTGKNIEISFSVVKGKTDTILKIVYGNNKTAYLVPLDANKKKFGELKYYKLSNNILNVVYYSAASGAVAYCYTLGKKNDYVKVTSSSYDCYLQLRLKADALVIPDQVTDDELFWPSNAPARLRIPGDNHFFIELLDKGNAMLTCLWDYPEQKIIINRSKDAKSFNEATFTCTPGSNIWFNFLNQKNIWYKLKEKLTDKYISINWTLPISAKYHMIFKRKKGRLPIEDNLSDMWVLLVRDKKIPRPSGMSLGRPKKMQAWTAGIGWVNYPCFIKNGKIRLSLPKFKKQCMKRVDYSNNIPVIYPFSALKDTPKNILLPLNAVRKFLGVACMKKLCMRKSSRNGFPATCGVTDRLEKIFYRGDAEVKKKQKYIRAELERMDIFVYSINAQIKENIKFTKTLQGWLKKGKMHYPKLTEQVNKYIKELQEIEKYYIIKKDLIKTPIYYMTLSKKLDQLIETKLDEEEKENKCKALGRKIRRIGGAQDAVAGQQRMYLKAIKQQVTLTLIKANDLTEIEFLEKFRKKINNKLRIRGMMEGK